MDSQITFLKGECSAKVPLSAVVNQLHRKYLKVRWGKLTPAMEGRDFLSFFNSKDIYNVTETISVFARSLGLRLIYLDNILISVKPQEILSFHIQSVQHLLSILGFNVHLEKSFLCLAQHLELKQGSMDGSNWKMCRLSLSSQIKNCGFCIGF